MATKKTYDLTWLVDTNTKTGGNGPDLSWLNDPLPNNNKNNAYVEAHGHGSILPKQDYNRDILSKQLPGPNYDYNRTILSKSIPNATPENKNVFQRAYDQAYKETYDPNSPYSNDFIPDWIDLPIRTVLDIPLNFKPTKRLLQGADEALGVPMKDVFGNEVKKETTGSGIVDKGLDLAGNLAGYGMIGPGNGVNALNFTDPGAEYLAQKTAAGLANAPKIIQSVAPAFVRGATDAGLFTAAEGVGNGEDIGTIAKNTALNAALGGGLFASGKGIGKGIENAKIKKELNSVINSKELDSGLLPIPDKNKYTVQMKNDIQLPDINPVTKPQPIVSKNKDLLDVLNNTKSLEKTNISESIPNIQMKPQPLGQVKKTANENTSQEILRNNTNLHNFQETLRNERELLNSTGQTKTVSSANGIKSEEPLTFRKIDEAATTVEPKTDNNGIARTEQKIVSSENSGKDSFVQKVKKFYTRFVDSNSPLKEIDNGTYVKATNSANAGGTVNYMFTDGLVDRNGKKIGDSLKDVVKDIPKDEYNDFWEYALQRHNIDRAREGKNVFADFTTDMSADTSAKWEKLHPEWKTKADKVTNWIDTFMKEWGINSGIVDEDLYKTLREKYPNYIPTNRAFDDVEEFIGGNGTARSFVDQRVPVRKATGSERDVVDPLENIMNLVNRTVRTAKYNEVGQSLLEAVRKAPDKMKPIAEIVKGEVNPNLKNIVTVLEKGKPVNLMINDMETLRSLQGLNKFVGDDLDNAVKKFNNLYKSLITTKNPVFALRNAARDLPTYLVNTKQKNPLGALYNLGSAAKDVVTNSESFQQYKALGGGGSNFFNSAKPYISAEALRGDVGAIKKVVSKIAGGIETFNNIIESAPRLAEFKATLKRTGNIEQALFDAADVTTNFSRGGDIAKRFDLWVPYFNAGIQGLDKLVRQFGEKPIQTTIKGAAVVTTPTLLINYWNRNNENYKNLDNRTKDNYYLIPYGDKFIKIPKSREYGVIFGSLAERTFRQANGEKDAFKGFGNTVATNFSPTNPIENNIFSPIFNLRANKDFANRDIVPRVMIEDGRSKKLQYDENTTEFAKAMAEASDKINIDLSPKQIDYIIKSYTGVIGQLAQPAMTKKNLTGNTLDKLTKPVTTQFISDPLYSNQAITDFYDNLDKMKQIKTDKNLTDNIDSKFTTDEEMRYNNFNKYAQQITDLNKEIRKAELNNDLEGVKRLRNQVIQIAKEANAGGVVDTYQDVKKERDNLYYLIDSSILPEKQRKSLKSKLGNKINDMMDKKVSNDEILKLIQEYANQYKK